MPSPSGGSPPTPPIGPPPPPPRKPPRPRVAVGRRDVGEVLDVAAHEIVVRLHEQHVDVLPGHRGPHRGPAPLELRAGNRRVDSLVHRFTTSSMFSMSPDRKRRRFSSP